MGIPNEETSAAPGEGSSPRTILILSALIVIAGALVHVGSLEGVFLFDDQSGIVENETIRSLSNPSRVLSPPHDTTVAGRPLVNLTLALNHAAGGLSVRGYHIVNLAVHLLAACALFSVTRRTLLRISSLSSSATSLAFATALLWVVHPLTTAPVSYIIQRAESLAALFSLWTLYCVARSEASKRKTLWWIAAIAACFCGVLTKEVAAVIPVLVIAWHWSFCRGTIRQILQRNALLYAGLVATWVPLAWVALGVRSRSVGFEFSEYSSWGYLKVQAGAVLHYLRLCLWPRPLAFDYGWPEIPAWTAAAGPGLVVLVLVVGSTLGLVRRHPLGFAGTAFFAVLAPTSSFIPVVTEVIAEHRVYLPLAAVIASVVGLGATAMSRRGIRPAGSVGLLLLAVAAAALATQTVARTRIYRNARAPWEDVLRSHPENARAHFILGLALEAEDNPDRAFEHYRDAVRLRPRYARAHNNLAGILESLGRSEEALHHYGEAIRLKPLRARPHHNLGALLGRLGDVAGAVPHLERAVELDPSYWKARINLGIAYALLGRIDDAMAQFEHALEIDRARAAETHYHIGATLERAQRADEARRHYEEALSIDPDHEPSRRRLRAYGP
jgi:Flp pilus assembly protein TadD